jgi:hypothetical protein
MAFVTAKRWVCNTCGREEDASDGQQPSNWLHIRWWRTDGTVYEIDLCGPRCALNAEKILKKTLAARHPPSETT